MWSNISWPGVVLDCIDSWSLHHYLLICLGEIHWIKIFVSWSYDQIEGQRECESMWQRLVSYVRHFQERRVRHNCKIEELEIRAVTKYFCKKGMPPKELMKTSWKPWRRNLRLIAQWQNGQQSLRGGEREHWGWWTVWLPQRCHRWGKC